ncbi:MAG: alanine racemase [Bacillota bacterium]
MAKKDTSRIVADIATPAVVVDLEILRRNIGRMAEYARQRGVKLRPHTKTHKCPAIAHLQMRAGASGITVAKVSEAEVMAQAGAGDILVAFPLVQEEAINRLLRLQRWVGRIACTVDNLEGASRLAKAALASPSPTVLDVLVEVDTGLHRVGLPPGRPVVEFVRALSELKGLHVRGLLTHAGHGHAAGSREELCAIADDEGRIMAETAGMLAEAGLAVEEVSIGSTPTLGVWRGCPGITEIRPGTYVFNDLSLVELGLAGIEDCALVVLTTVVSHPEPGRLVLDAGSKTLSSDPAHTPESGFGRIVGYPHLKIEKLYEEHGTIRIMDPPGTRPVPAIGEVLAVIPNHVCPVVNLADELIVTDHGEIVAKWPVAGRGRVI